jgi:Fic family protein
MGRLWQTLILMQQYPVFEFLPIESLIKQEQEKYYTKLSESDKIGKSTPFIEFMLSIILEALNQLLKSQNKTLKTVDRIALFQEKIGVKKFSRKDYLQSFKNISAPTASRDLRWAVEQRILEKEGEQRMVVYKFKRDKDIME